MTILVVTHEMGTFSKEVAREFYLRQGIGVIHHELIHSPHDLMAKNQESDVYCFLDGSKEELAHWCNDRARDGYGVVTDGHPPRGDSPRPVPVHLANVSQDLNVRFGLRANIQRTDHECPLCGQSGHPNTLKAMLPEAILQIFLWQ